MHNLGPYDALMAISDGIKNLTGGRLGIDKITDEDRLVYTDRSGKRFHGEHATREATVFYGFMWNRLQRHEEAQAVAAGLMQEDPALEVWEKSIEDAMKRLIQEGIDPAQLVTLGDTKAKEFIEHTTYGWWADWTTGNEPFDTI